MKWSKWTEEELQILRDAYVVGDRHYVQKVLKANGFHRTIKAIGATAKRYQIKSNRNGQFKPGHKPQNKGKGMDKDTLNKVKRTWFKKGHEPAGTLHDGAITKRKDNRGVYNYHIRISKGKWVYLSRYIWEQEFGPIPKGMIITYKDGNPMNCVVDNLEMISRLENLQRRQKQAGGHPGTNLSDGYVRGVLIKRGIDPKSITSTMIETKRLQLILNREIKEHETESSN